MEKIWKFQQYVMNNKKKAKLSRLLRMSVRKARTYLDLLIEEIAGAHFVKTSMLHKSLLEKRD